MEVRVKSIDKGRAPSAQLTKKRTTVTSMRSGRQEESKLLI